MYAYRRRPVLAFMLVALCTIASGCSSVSERRSVERPKSRDIKVERAPPTFPTFLRQDRWRSAEEEACLASGVVRSSPSVAFRSSLGGPGGCHVIRPLEVAAIGPQHVALRPSATLQCPMVPAIEHWLTTVVAPAARRHLRGEVVELKVASSYSCRRINGSGRLSEHGRANAIDISAFHLADGRTVVVKSGWRGAAPESGFLREVHRGACATFNTVLGPNADAYHHDHFHFDLARHGRDGSYRVCR
ncbi:MAG: extensin family protein [Hyphomicrobiaceae bacterium]